MSFIKRLLCEGQFDQIPYFNPFTDRPKADRSGEIDTMAREWAEQVEVLGGPRKAWGGIKTVLEHAIGQKDTDELLSYWTSKKDKNEWYYVFNTFGAPTPANIWDSYQAFELAYLLGMVSEMYGTDFSKVKSSADSGANRVIVDVNPVVKLRDRGVVVVKSGDRWEAFTGHKDQKIDAGMERYKVKAEFYGVIK